jgi:hypothetical protein
MEMKQGYLYIANNEHFFNEAIISAKSLRKVDEKAHITLITNKQITSNLFDNIIIKQTITSTKDKLKKWQEGLLYRVKHIYEDSPYEKTFFIDCDTYFCDNSNELFDILNYYDLCIAQAPSDSTEIEINNKTLKGYLPYNCGVIVFKKNQENKKLFQSWYNIYNKKFKESFHDQSAFMEALLKVKSRVYVLQNIYNARTPFHISFINKPVKIIHGRHKNYERVKKEINKKTVNRSWRPPRK